MYGYPKVIKTRQDVEYLVSYLGTDWATDDNKQRGLAYLRALRDKTQHYVFDRVLAEGEEPDGPEPEYRVTEDEDGARHQHVLVDDPNAPIHRLDFTAGEVNQLIQTVESH
ncbi:hypothetical protein [Chromohalobacter sp. 48-RD10]|uniref:hypothetical protein n=1 Tax=Chromohalobacter sp. 48-RD10 TaxID=2994063 RepID=UPI0024696E80|nr:hypothetical protein [Chromohalobacter sp. 48-RD10]